MAHILTLQSHVVYGHAGNAAAVFPMQRLGHQVSTLNLLQFSNHTGYGEWGGKAIPLEELKEVFAGLKKIGVYENIDAIVTGYTGSREQAEAIYEFVKEVKAVNPNVIYCCDPVMGDEHTGMYVKPEVAEFVASDLVKLADFIMPNRYELSRITGMEITDIASAKAAGDKLLAHGTKVLATSVATSEDHTGMLLNTGDELLAVELPKYEVGYTVRGTGDVVTALFTSHLLANEDYATALEKTANAMHHIVEYTHRNNLSELGIVQSQQAIAHPEPIFKVSAVKEASYA